ncbi:MFS transporter [Nocardioides rotundus]|uniref:MFS transporter n=1 Tax=Nocardioides rotundus TaxID=1774216 RepID=UPI001CBEA9AB|nr:MFS transporter [Nocardioides rotundus]UAL29957.1 MFS transporter [Nocardioides rotundus]
MHPEQSEPSPWLNPRFRWFAAGNTFNNIGDGVEAALIPLLIYAETSSVTWMGIAAALTPGTLLLGPVMGSVADKYGSARLVVGGLGMQLVAASLLAWMVTADKFQIGLFFALAGILQVAGSVYRVGWMSSVPELFPGSPVRARGTLSSLFVATTIAGPLVVAALLPVVGYGGLLWLNCTTYVAPVLVYFAGVRPARRQGDGGSSLAMVIDGFKTGFVVFWGHRQFRLLTLILLPYEFVGSAAMPTLAVYHLRDSLTVPAATVATIIAVLNGAALMGSLWVSERRVFNPGRVVGVVTVGAALALFGASMSSVVIVVGSLTLLMALDGAAGATHSMTVVKFVPHEVFGRTSGVVRLIHGVPAVTGPLVIAAVVPVIGTGYAFLALAGIAVASAVAFFAAGDLLERSSKNGVVSG